MLESSDTKEELNDVIKIRIRKIESQIFNNNDHS